MLKTFKPQVLMVKAAHEAYRLQNPEEFRASVLGLIPGGLLVEGRGDHSGIPSWEFSGYPGIHKIAKDSARFENVGYGYAGAVQVTQF